MSGASSERLTTPDLVVLSLLTERPMHGYEANAVLEFRNVRDWAGVSRPQVYYSLEKLASLRLIQEAHAAGEQGRGDAEPEKPGPDRRIFGTTAKGRTALADALERENWGEQLDRPPFLTWLALSWQCRTVVATKQIERRRQFLMRELTRKNEMLDNVVTEVGHQHHEAVWMLKLTTQQMETELRWLEQLRRELPLRKGAEKSALPQQ